MSEPFLNNFEEALIKLFNQNAVLAQYNWMAWDSDADLALPRGYIELESTRSVELSPLYQITVNVTLEGKPKQQSLSDVQHELETTMSDDELCATLQELADGVHYFGRMAESVSLRRLIRGDKRNLLLSCYLFAGPTI